MSIKDILLATYIALSKLFKNKLLKALQSLREKYVELEETITQLKAENAKLKEQLKSAKIKSVNKNDYFAFYKFQQRILSLNFYNTIQMPYVLVLSCQSSFLLFS